MGETDVVLTTDVHHMSLNTKDQQLIDKSEAALSLEYASIARDHGVPVTCFITGKTLEEEPSTIQSLDAVPSVEIGGHGYFAAHPKWLYNGLFSRLLQQDNGPYWYQDWEVRSTVRALRETTGKQVRSWRDHAYRRDSNTYDILHRNGVRVVSDTVGPMYGGPTSVELSEDRAITSVPINVLPDSDHLYHGHYSKGKVSTLDLKRSEFEPVMFEPGEWLRVVKKQVVERVKDGGVATLLIHPAPMEIVDGFTIFEDVCQFLSKYRCATISELKNCTGGST